MKKILILLFCPLFFYSCRHEVTPEPTPTPVSTGNISFSFIHKVDNVSIIKDTFAYTNAAGNIYLISELQYFISDVTLNKSDGGSVVINNPVEFYYIDTNIPSTLTWNVGSSITACSYNSITFTFGIPDAKNTSYMFVNPPQNNMFWPEYLGGGYHYMKFNGKYKDTLNLEKVFNYHMGRGQIYDINNNIIGFVPNEFTVTLPNSAFTITKDQTTSIQIVMNIENWFKPNIFDLNFDANNMMQRQESMNKAKLNGQAGVFSVGAIN